MMTIIIFQASNEIKSNSFQKSVGKSQLLGLPVEVWISNTTNKTHINHYCQILGWQFQMVTGKIYHEIKSNSFDLVAGKDHSYVH